MVAIADRVVYACDVGSTLSGRFGWARATDPASLEGGTSISELADHLRADLATGRSVALGFEAPLFIPLPADPARLSRGRDGEGARSWAAPAGASVATLGLHQAAWLLNAIRPAGKHHRFSQSPADWPPRGPLLFAWEAFVSGPTHGESHVHDAAAAVIEFLEAEDNLSEESAVDTAEPPISLVGAAALRSGWSQDLGELSARAVVIRPEMQYHGPLRVLDPVTP